MFSTTYLMFAHHRRPRVLSGTSANPLTAFIAPVLDYFSTPSLPFLHGAMIRQIFWFYSNPTALMVEYG